MSLETRLDALLSRWQGHQARGEDVTAADLCRDCPDLLPEVERRLHALRQMQHLGETGDLLATPGMTSSPSAQPAAPPRAVTGYEILDELGRGGMGVVYKARQTALKRLVALKMILAGAHAGGEHLARFRAEAEVVARLKHPNIVEIHEIGAAEGRPYFSLEFVEGGSLEKKLAGTPLPPREAAALVETLARAMHYAHDHGIVHRDLKPANVLLTADGQPKITDFGLAKQLEEDAGRTRSGAVLGTPSYMAPEQAGGKAIGPRTDVYALGATFYETLTGRPPFKAASVLETLEQVRFEEPAPPSRLQMKLPRDLETICLKCLHKEPERRYDSALALAEDLRRFLNDEPIRARPVGALERSWRWCRRNPALAAISAACVLLLVGSLVGLTGLYLHAEQQREQAESERAHAERERRRAETERQRADEERDAARAAAVEVKRQKEAAETQRLAAQKEADRARQVTGFLVEMFNASDPLGLFNLNEPDENLTARQLLERGAKRIADSKQMAPRVRADILDAVGNVYRSMGRHAEAEPLLTQALALRRAARASPAEEAASLHSLARLDHERGNYSRAVKLYREALALQAREATPDRVAVSNSQFDLAWVLVEMEEYDEAEKLFREVIARRMALFGPDHRQTALAKTGLVALYLDAGRYSAAAPLANEVLGTFRKLGGNQDLLDGVVKFQQGVFWGNMLGNHEAAEKLLRESLALARKGLGPRHQYVTMPLVQLAFTLEKRGKLAEAEEQYAEAVAIIRERVGFGHPKVLAVAPHQARLLQRRGQGKQAEALFEEILAAHQQRFGARSVLVADVLYEYGLHLYRSREPARSEKKLHEALALYRADSGPVRRRFVECLRSLGHACFRKNEFSGSEPYYREALAAARKRPWAKLELTLALENLVAPLLKQGKLTTEVEELLSEAEQLVQSLTAQERIEVQHLLMQHRCFVLRSKGRHAAAAVRLREYLKTATPTPVYLEHVAMEFALCIPLARQDQSLTVAARERLVEEYGREAVAVLRQLLQRGGTNPQRWAASPLLASLRDRGDFQGLVAEAKKQR